LEKDSITCEFISRTEAAKMLGIKPNTMAAWMCRGNVTLPYLKFGRQVRYRISDIHDFIKKNTLRKT
jgi:excisionase family DNA binding protein